MKTRPTSVTVIAWVLLAIGAISLIAGTLMLNNPMSLELMKRSPIPITVQYTMMYLGLLVTVTSGVGMLKGKNWARLLYVIWSGVGFLIGVATSPMKTALIPGFVLYLVVVFFLFRPKANRYFGKSEVESGTESH